jgi:DNA invertase Pin-like site-specific DNA recombinase
MNIILEQFLSGQRVDPAGPDSSSTERRLSRSLNRPGLKELKADIERGKITRVWVADLTRLSRDPAGLESFRMYLALHKVELTVAMI